MGSSAGSRRVARIVIATAAIVAASALVLAGDPAGDDGAAPQSGPLQRAIEIGRRIDDLLARNESRVGSALECTRPGADSQEEAGTAGLRGTLHDAEGTSRATAEEMERLIQEILPRWRWLDRPPLAGGCGT